MADHVPRPELAAALWSFRCYLEEVAEAFARARVAVERGDGDAAEAILVEQLTSLQARRRGDREDE